MKKLLKVASIGLLALTIFGCSKKATKKSSTKNTTKDNRTSVVSTSNTTKKVTSKTTKKTTTQQQTTIDKKEFKEVSYTTLMEKVNSITPTKKYVKAIANGTYERSPETYATVTDRLYMLNQENNFVNSGSHIMVDTYVTNQMLKTVPEKANFNYFMNAINEFKIIANNDDSGSMEFTFDCNCYTKTVKQIAANGTIACDLTIDWYESDYLDNYSIITMAEAVEIADTYTIENYKYMGAIITGTYENNNTHNIYTLEFEPLQYSTSGNYYYPYDMTVPTDPIGSFNGLKTKYTFYAANTFFYKNENNELALVTYRMSEDEKLYVERTIKFNDCGYAKYVEDKIIENYGSTSTFYLENYNVQYFETAPTVTVTLFSGLGKFSNGETEKTITGTPGLKLSEFTGYEVPNLTGASFWQYSWYDAYTDSYHPDAQPIYKEAAFTYGFIDSDYTSTPTVQVSFGAKSETNTSSIVIKVEYYDNKVQGVAYSGVTSICYTKNNYITISYDSGDTLTFWGAIKSISFGDEENGLYMQGNKRVTRISAIRSLQYHDYCCANMTGLLEVIQSNYDRYDYSIGDYAFYNCTNLTSAKFQYAPASIGKYAFANTGLKDILQGDLFKADFIDYAAFDNLANATLILVPIDLKYDEEKEEYNVDFDSLNYLFYNSNWNGLNNDTITPYKLCISSDYLDGTKIVLSLTDISNVDNICFNLSSYYKYDISIDLDLDGTGSVTLKKALSDTNLLDVDKSNPSDSLTDYIPDETYWFVIDMVLYAFDDATVTIAINCKEKE